MFFGLAPAPSGAGAAFRFLIRYRKGERGGPAFRRFALCGIAGQGPGLPRRGRDTSAKGVTPVNNPVAAISMRNVTKRFGPVVANDHVNLDIYHGEILALLGKTAAAKPR